MARPSFHPLRVADVRRETADTVSILFEVPPGLTEAFRFSPGQFLTVRVAGFDGEPVRRSYSICSGVDDGELRIAVKQLAGGIFGVLAGESLRVGDMLEVLPPLGRFTVTPDPARRAAYLGIAAGSGITPVISIARSVLAGEPDSRFTLVYGNRGPSTVIFREALADLKDCYLDRFQLLHVFSRELTTQPLLSGRIDSAKLQALGERLLDLTAYDEVLVCGPEAMTLDVREAFLALGVPAEHVHAELFGSHSTAPQAAATAMSATPGEGDVRLRIELDGIRTEITARAGETILEAATRAGMDMPFSCRGGVCATCRARVAEGAVEMAVNYSLQPWETDAGFVLTCQSRPTTPRVVVDYDAV